VSEVTGAPAAPSNDIETIPVSDVAETMSIPVSRVHQLASDGQLLIVEHDGVAAVPADFFAADGEIVKGLSGTIIVLRDGGYPDAEILRWLFTDDESLPGSPIAAMQAGRHKEVARRAQAMAF
jgi:hypothetical protein